MRKDQEELSDHEEIVESSPDQKTEIDENNETL